jgi:hypothetical protein
MSLFERLGLEFAMDDVVEKSSACRRADEMVNLPFPLTPASAAYHYRVEYFLDRRASSA